MKIHFVPVKLKIKAMVPVRAKSMKRARKTVADIFWKGSASLKNETISRMVSRSWMSNVPSRLSSNDPLNMDREGKKFFRKQIKDGDWIPVKERLRIR